MLDVLELPLRYSLCRLRKLDSAAGCFLQQAWLWAVQMKRFLHKLLGDRGERAAARYLKKKGYRIVSRQYRNQFGEIDLIALDGQQIVFVEVKTRSSTANGQPFEAVHDAKQKKLTKLALVWLKKHQRMKQTARFDIVSIVWPDGSRQPDIEHFRNAFEAQGKGQFFS